ncbi:bifunctional diguanylate cyclase/phosphodiesterase [Stenotrophomonas sp. JC08]|uniref:bifunctional diguanylate cyclase/phosphodiesterase n=1 Tax=Stenotrophomonas sp. JC08 TaxID=3445779 RepID=UPI003FA30F70
MPHTRSRTSLIHRLSLNIWGLFVALLLLLSTLGYLAMRMAADRVVPMVAQRTVDLRARASEGLFLQAEQSVSRLQLELLRRLDSADQATTLVRFDTLFARSSDGLWRLRPEQVAPASAPTLYLHHPPQGLDDSIRLRAVAAYDLLREQGPALAPPFFSVYMDFVEDGLMVYSPDIDWGKGADATASNTSYPTMLGANPQRNPQRQVFWTPVYLDRQAATWMVSVIKPLDWRQRWVGTLGHDVSVQSLIDRIDSGGTEDGIQLVMDADGTVIAHPQLHRHIVAADGQLQLATLDDPLLPQVHRMISQASMDAGAGRSPDGSHWVAWSKIRGPGWYQIYLLPQARVNDLLSWGLLALAAAGMLGLLPAMWVLRRRVNTLFAVPLKRLTQAVDELGQGRVPSPIDMRGDDELGRLATAFDDMVEELGHQRTLQFAHAKALQAEVDERRQFMNRLEEERARLLALLGAMNLGIVFISIDNRVTYCNATFLVMWQFPESSTVVGRTTAENLQQAKQLMVDQATVLAQLEAAPVSGQSTRQLEIRLRDGRTIMHNAYPVPDAQGQHIGHLWVQEDVSHQRRTAQQLVRLAHHDPLTGLYNRRRFENDLTSFFHDAQHTPCQAALLFFDLDEFKYINDTFGHRAGDAVLNRLALEVRTLVRSGETLFRLGGDEFAVMMPHASQYDAQHLAERIVQRIARTPLRLLEQTVRLGASLGIAHFPTHADNADDLVAHADAAMYQAKHQGKNRWNLYRPDRDSSREMASRLVWNDRIARALEQDLLCLHFQGVYHADDGRLAHLEALIRMRDEVHTGQLIMPGQFIVPAERSGKILEIDRWVIHQCIKLLASHPQLPAIAINISGRSFDDPELPVWIGSQLQRQRVAPQRLLVELTETAAISDMGDAARFIAALRETGCPICLDDFGTGFASFAYLKNLQADVLKIDGMFIRNLPDERDNQVFVRAIIEVAHGMGKLAVAEFVEDADTLQMLREMGVDMVQGYHLDRPRADHPALAKQ